MSFYDYVAFDHILEKKNKGKIVNGMFDVEACNTQHPDFENYYSNKGAYIEPDHPRSFVKEYLENDGKVCINTLIENMIYSMTYSNKEKTQEAMIHSLLNAAQYYKNIKDGKEYRNRRPDIAAEEELKKNRKVVNLEDIITNRYTPFDLCRPEDISILMKRISFKTKEELERNNYEEVIREQGFHNIEEEYPQYDENEFGELD